MANTTGLLTMFARTVEAACGVPNQPCPRRDLDDASASDRVHLPEEPDRFLKDMHRSPEIHGKHGLSDVIRRALDFSEDGVASVAHDDVEAAEDFLRLLERGEDVVADGDIDLEDKQLLGRVLPLEVREHLGFAEGGDGDVTFLEDAANDVQPQARRRPRD